MGWFGETSYLYCMNVCFMKLQYRWWTQYAVSQPQAEKKKKEKKIKEIIIIVGGAVPGLLEYWTGMPDVTKK